MKLQSKVIIVLLVPLLFSGCAGLTGRAQQERSKFELNQMKRDFQRLNAEVAELSRSRQDLYRDMERLKDAVAIAEKQNAELSTSVDVKLSSITAAAESREKRMIDEITRSLTALIANSGGGSAGGGAVRGNTHIVRSGETLSEIAKVYGVTMNVLIKANNIKNANNLKVGDEIFIPE